MVGEEVPALWLVYTRLSAWWKHGKKDVNVAQYWKLISFLQETFLSPWVYSYTVATIQFMQFQFCPPHLHFHKHRFKSLMQITSNDLRTYTLLNCDWSMPDSYPYLTILLVDIIWEKNKIVSVYQNYHTCVIQEVKKKSCHQKMYFRDSLHFSGQMLSQ